MTEKEGTDRSTEKQVTRPQLILPFTLCFKRIGSNLVVKFTGQTVKRDVATLLAANCLLENVLSSSFV
jgi:hypothetical protein